MARMVRKQVYVEPSQEQFLKRRARELGVTEADLVRQGIRLLSQTPLAPATDPDAWADEEALLAGLVERAHTAVREILAHEVLREQAITDPLTGLGNRRKLSTELTERLAHAAGQPLVLMNDGNPRMHQVQPDHADRQVDEEDPRPRKIGDDESAHRRPEQRRGNSRLRGHPGRPDRDQGAFRWRRPLQILRRRL